MDEQLEQEKLRFKRSLLFPVFFVTVLWVIKLLEYAFRLDLYYLGINPLKLEGLIGIITSPLIHGDFKHLFNNTFPVLFLSIALFYFYRPIQFKIFILIYLFTGIWVWFGGRPSFHIGASGIIYGLASFLFFSGIIRNDVRLMAISLIVTFLYGSLIWGIFPFKEGISWESHLWGGVAGFILSIFYRKHGPQRKKFDWEYEEEEEKWENETDQKENNHYYVVTKK